MPLPLPLIVLLEPMNASVSLSSVATPTAAPTPTKPPASPIWMSCSLLSSLANTRTSLSALSCTDEPVLAKVCRVTRLTPTLPATPTVPPPAPATTERIVSFAFAVMEMSPRALTFVELSMNASVLMCTIRTPTGTATPAVPPMAREPAMPSS